MKRKKKYKYIITYLVTMLIPLVLAAIFWSSITNNRLKNDESTALNQTINHIQSAQEAKD